jgi:hypothetical protein
MCYVRACVRGVCCSVSGAAGGCCCIPHSHCMPPVMNRCCVCCTPAAGSMPYPCSLRGDLSDATQQVVAAFQRAFSGSSSTRRGGSKHGWSGHRHRQGSDTAAAAAAVDPDSPGEPTADTEGAQTLCTARCHARVCCRARSRLAVATHVSCACHASCLRVSQRAVPLRSGRHCCRAVQP